MIRIMICSAFWLNISALELTVNQDGITGLPWLSTFGQAVDVFGQPTGKVMGENGTSVYMWGNGLGLLFRERQFREVIIGRSLFGYDMSKRVVTDGRCNLAGLIRLGSDHTEIEQKLNVELNKSLSHINVIHYDGLSYGLRHQKITTVRGFDGVVTDESVSYPIIAIIVAPTPENIHDLIAQPEPQGRLPQDDAPMVDEAIFDGANFF